ncbi:MAG TPA: alpha/beta fold hydrolase [Thermoleophilaceae bacterium]|jgi:pimeloyl-ACP methyl ester carboxylesterase|nr:alpha/beta fold hydrolase [Thermoleophilaceae bacterium]
MARTLPAALRHRALLLILAGIAALALTSEASASPPVPRLDWQPCDGSFECATARVPLDHDRPHGRKIELALIRAPAADPDSRIGSLFVHPGGPGSPGTDNIRNAPPPVIGLLTRRFDLVGVDLRGEGASSPTLDCRVDHETAGLNAQPFFGPDTLDVGALVGRARSYVQRCQELNGELMGHMSTADVARDLDLLRAAVGDERLTFLGNSYGSLVGATYTSLFPGRTRALALTAAVDADAWTNRPFEALREQTAGLEDVLDRFFSACAANQQACGFGESDPETAFDDLLGRLDREPIPAPGSASGRDLDGDDLRVAGALAVLSPRQWPRFASGLRQAQQGEGSILRTMTDEFYGGASQGHDVSLATLALDQRYPRRVEPFLDAGRQAARLFRHFAAFNNGYNELPLGLVRARRGDAYHGPFRHSAKSPAALVVGTTHDSNTPYVWAKRLTADLGNARLLTFRGDGHDALTSLNACLVGHLLAYLEETVLPHEGASCQREAPFGG